MPELFSRTLAAKWTTGHPHKHGGEEVSSRQEARTGNRHANHWVTHYLQKKTLQQSLKVKKRVLADSTCFVKDSIPWRSTTSLTASQFTVSLHYTPGCQNITWDDNRRCVLEYCFVQSDHFVILSHLIPPSLQLIPSPPHPVSLSDYPSISAPAPLPPPSITTSGSIHQRHALSRWKANMRQQKQITSQVL